MEENTIVVFDPFDEPFGPLSPNFQKSLLVGETRYRSISHYIYSQGLKNPSFSKQIINQTSTRNLRQLAQRLRDEEKIFNSRLAIETANAYKFKNPKLRDELLSTGNAILVYQSEDNTDLGVNKKGVGKNLLGKQLMALRDLLSIEYYRLLHEEKYRQYMGRLYEAYLVDKILREMIVSGNNDLGEFTDSVLYNPSQIMEKFGRQKVIREGVSYDAFTKILEFGQVPEYIFHEAENPGYLAVFNRALHLDRYIRLLKLQEKKLILKEYFSYIIKKKFGITSDSLVTTELAKLDAEEIQDLEDRLFVLFQNNLLPREIGEKHKERYQYLPTRNDVINAEDEANRLISVFRQNQSEKREDIQQVPQAVIDQKSKERSSRGLTPSPVIALAEYIRDKVPSVSSYETPSPESLRKLVKKLKQQRAQVIKYWKEQMSDEEKAPYYNKALEIQRQTGSLNKEEEEILSDSEEEVSMPIESNGAPVITFSNNGNSEYDFMAPDYILPKDTPGGNMIVIDYLPYPSVIHYMRAVQMVLGLSYIKNIKQAHSYLMIDPLGDINDSSNYIDGMYLYEDIKTKVEDDIRFLQVEAAVKGNELKFQDHNLAALLLATGAKNIVYMDYRDPVFGIGSRDDGSNIMGEILMANRLRIAQEGEIKPAIVEIVHVTKLAEILREDVVLQSWFNSRIKDIVGSIKIVANYLVKGGETSEITSDIVDLVVNKIYANCMSIYDKNATVHTIPKEFVKIVRDEFKPYDKVSRSAIEIIWRYMSYLLARLTDLASDKSTKEDIGETIQKVVRSRSNITDVKCAGPFDKRKNCVASSLRNILEAVQSYFFSQNKQFKVKDDEVNLAIMILTPKFKMEDIQVKSSGYDSRMMKSALGINMEEIYSQLFNNYADALLAINDPVDLTVVNSRITFFATTN